MQLHILTSDHRQGWTINSLSNMSDSRWFCPALDSVDIDPSIYNRFCPDLLLISFRPFFLLSVFSLLKAEWNYHKYLKSFADFAELKTSKTVGWVYILIPIDMGDADLLFSFKMIIEYDVQIRFLLYSTVLYSILTHAFHSGLPNRCTGSNVQC